VVAVGAVIAVGGLVTGRFNVFAGGATLSLLPATSTTSLGGAVAIEIRLDTGGNDVVAATTVVTYDPAQLELTGGTDADSVLPYDLEQSISSGSIRVSRGVPGNGLPADLCQVNLPDTA
jgi:hypothetical protein